MARLLSKQDDFRSQKSQVEEMITERGHLCIFLPKFHCKLNPIEMVCFYFIPLLSALNPYSTGAGVNTDTGKFIRTNLRKQRRSRVNPLTRAQLMLSGSSSTGLGGLWKHIGRDSLERLPNGRCVNRNHTGGSESRL